jgi:hypothetical protein
VYVKHSTGCTTDPQPFKKTRSLNMSGSFMTYGRGFPGTVLKYIK